MPLRGVRVKIDDVNVKEFRLTQFADDTQLLIKGFQDLYRMWELLQEYEDASGMRANKSKFEGIRCGALRKKGDPCAPGPTRGKDKMG